MACLMKCSSVDTIAGAELAAACPQVLDEIGVDVSAQMGSAPTKKMAAKQQEGSAQEEENANLTARLAALK